MIKRALMAALIVAGSFALVSSATAGEREVEIPPQYRGAWCTTKWTDIYRRCRESDRGVEFIIERHGWSSEDWACKPLAARKGNGEHRMQLLCRDDGGVGKAETREERWRLGTNGTRLMIIRRVEGLHPTVAAGRLTYSIRGWEGPRHKA